MKRLLITVLTFGLALTACGGGSGGAAAIPTSTAAAVAATSPYTCPSAQTSSGALDCTKLPLGDRKFTTTGAKSGLIYMCRSLSGSPAASPGAWLNASAGTWNALQKVAVQGAVSWNGSFSQSTTSTTRSIASNGLPINGITTGIFPIQRTDPAFQYDGNPNHIAAQNFVVNLPLNPTAAASPECEGMGPIGITVTGVAIYNAFDGAGYDGVAREEQDTCHGHPDQSSTYHYHGWLQACVRDSGSPTQNSSLLGYAADGYGIYGAWYNGKILTSKDLDVCHGVTSAVMWNGKLTTIYHYVSTYDFPYTVACYHGTATRI